MSLNNSQYDSIMRGYSRKQAAHRHLLEERTAQIYQKLPRIREIDDAIASASVQSARQMLAGDPDALSRLKERIAAFGQERREVLLAGGFSPDDLEMTYDCPDCRDTGYIGGEKCHCFKKAEIALLYTQSNLEHILEKENFNTFSFAYYSDKIKEETSGVSSLERIHWAVDTCRRFVERFDTDFANLFFYGDTGVGKTFLSHCVARELLESTHSVVYFSAQELFEVLARSRFGRADAQETSSEAIYTCDLLIIDDLGTELTNAFVNSELFLCLNERLANRRSTVISTNLSLKAFSETYSERIFSRVTDGFIMLKLFGEDIRLLKRMGRKPGEQAAKKA